MPPTKYFLLLNDTKEGPVTLEEMAKFHSVLKPNTRILRLPSTVFVDAETLPEVKELYLDRRPSVPGINPEPVVDSTGGFRVSLEDINELARREKERIEREEQLKREQEISTQTVIAPPPPFEEAVMEKKEWFLTNSDGLQEGPMTLSGLKAKNLTEDSMVWRSDFSSWLPATEVPEVAAFVAASRTVPPTPRVPDDPGPVIPGPHPDDEEDTSAEDAIHYGSPFIVPVCSIFASAIFIVFSLLLVLVTNLNDKLTEIFNCSGSHDFDIFDGILYLSFAIGITPALVLSICAIANANAAKNAYMRYENKRSFKKSGAATAYGWGGIIYSLAGLVACGILYYYGYLEF